MDCVAVPRGDWIDIVEFRRLKAGEPVFVGRTEDGRKHGRRQVCRSGQGSGLGVRHFLDLHLVLAGARGSDKEVAEVQDPPNRLILAGAAMNSFCSALISFVLLYFQNNLRTSMAWMMGKITLSGWVPVRVLIPLVLIGLTGQLVSAYSLNVLQFGDDQASSLGLDAGGVQRRTIFFATLTTASAISFAGVIGFVGLIVPHVVRLLIGADYRKILPLSILGGGLFLLTADLIARRAFAPQEFPVGLITALTGAPFFFWLLSERKADRS